MPFLLPLQPQSQSEDVRIAVGDSEPGKAHQSVLYFARLKR